MAVATPSSGVTTPRRLERGVAALRDLGYRVRVGALATAPTESRSAAERAAELNAFLRDPEVRCVVAAIGGLTSSSILAYLDYEAIRADPKILLGYSDITAILLAVLAVTGTVTFHGPTLLPELAEYPRPLPYTREGLLRAVTSPEPIGRLTPAAEWTEEFLPWDEADDRPRRTVASKGWQWLHGGTGTGPLVGGNLETLAQLAGTPYLPDADGAVILLETTSTVLADTGRLLTGLERLGFLDRMTALLVGRSFRAPGGFEGALAGMLTERFGDRGVPIVTGMDVGHSDPMLTLPLGVRVRVNASLRSVEVLDAAVR